MLELAQQFFYMPIQLHNLVTIVWPGFASKSGNPDGIL